MKGPLRVSSLFLSLLLLLHFFSSLSLQHTVDKERELRRKQTLSLLSARTKHRERTEEEREREWRREEEVRKKEREPKTISEWIFQWAKSIFGGNEEAESDGSRLLLISKVRFPLLISISLPHAQTLFPSHLCPLQSIPYRETADYPFRVAVCYWGATR